MAGRGLPATRGDALRAFFKHPSPVVLTILLVFLLVLRPILGDWSWWDLIVPAALLVVWPVYEWLIHIFILHARPVKLGPVTLDMRAARIHRDHHADPWYLPDTFIPFHVIPLTGIPLVAAAYLLVPAGIATTYLAAYLVLSLHYEWCHYLAHIDWCPNSSFYRRRVRLHRLHHFHHERLWWGVSSAVGDKILGTAPDVKVAPRSETTHDLLAGRWFRRDP